MMMIHRHFRSCAASSGVWVSLRGLGIMSNGPHDLVLVWPRYLDCHHHGNSMPSIVTPQYIDIDNASFQKKSIICYSHVIKD